MKTEYTDALANKARAIKFIMLALAILVMTAIYGLGLSNTNTGYKFFVITGAYVVLLTAVCVMIWKTFTNLEVRIRGNEK